MQMTRFWKKKKNLTLVQRKTYASATQDWEKKCVCVETLIKAFSISATSLAVVTTGAELAVITALRQSRVNRTGQCYQESVAAADMWWLTVMQLILTVCSPVMAALYFWNTESVFVLYVTTTENTKSPKSRLWTVLDSSGVSSEGINHLPYMNALLMQRLSTFRDTLNANFLTRNLFTCRTGLPAVHICPLNECLLKENNHQTAADDW